MVDAMVAVLVLAIGLAALAALYTRGTGVFFGATNSQRAVQIATTQLDKVKFQDQKLSTISDLSTYIENINKTPTDSSVTIDNITYKTSIVLGDCLNSGSTTGDQYIYPVYAKVTWTNSGNQSETIVLSTYITLIKASS